MQGICQEKVEAISHVYSVQSVEEAVYVSPTVNGKPLRMEVNRGAKVTVMAAKYSCPNFPNTSLEKCNVKLKASSGHGLELLGKVNIKVTYNNKSSVLLLYITKSTMITALFGRTWLNFMVLTRRQNLLSINNGVSEKCNISNVIQDLQGSYPNVFNEDRSQAIREVSVDLHVQDDVIPVFHKSYSIPYAVKPAVESEIDDMVKSGVLIPVRHSKWDSPIVVVPRKSCKIRICVDFKTFSACHTNHP